MADPLVRCPPGHPCPNCGCTESVEALSAVLNGLCDEERRRRDAKDRSRAMLMATQAEVDAGTGVGGSRTTGGAGGIVTITGGPGPVDIGGGITASALQQSTIELTGFLTCVKCGTKFADDHRDQAESLRKQIREKRIEMEGAIGLLGELADDPI